MWWLMLMSMMRKQKNPLHPFMDCHGFVGYCKCTNAFLTSRSRSKYDASRRMMAQLSMPGPWQTCWVQDLEMFRCRFPTLRLSCNLASLASQPWTLHSGKSGNRTQKQVFCEILLSRVHLGSFRHCNPSAFSQRYPWFRYIRMFVRFDSKSL